MATPPPFLFVAGDDDFLVNRVARERFQTAAANALDPMSVEEIDGDAATVDEVATAMDQLTAAVRTLSLFGDRKIVWFKGLSFLGDGRTASAEGTRVQIERLRELLESINPEAVTLILSAAPLDKRRAFAKWVAKQPGFIETASAAKGNAFEQLIEESVRDAGKKIHPEALELLKMKINGNIRMGASEIEKLVLAVGDETPTVLPEHIIEWVPEFGEAQFFDAAEAFYTLRIEVALTALRRHFFSHKEGRPLLNVLLNRNRLLLLLKSLLDSGEIEIDGRGTIRKGSLDAAAQSYADRFGDPTVKDSINIFAQNPWYLANLARTARRLSLKQLVDFQQAFLGVFSEIVDRPKEQETVFADCFSRCLG